MSTARWPKRSVNLWMAVGDGITIILALLAIPGTAFIALADVPPHESNPTVHLALRGALVGWYFAVLGFLSASLFSDRTWKWAVLLWVPLGALLSAGLIGTRFRSPLIFPFIFSFVGSLGSVALANRIRASVARWWYFSGTLAVLFVIVIVIIRRLS